MRRDSTAPPIRGTGRRLAATGPAPTGFSAVELLAAMGIIGLLVAVLLPAVQRTRERSRNVSCASHLKQLGVALSSFETQQQRFPPCNVEFPSNSPDQRLKTVSIHYQLLPYLEQSSLFQQIRLDQDVWQTAAEPPESSLNADALRIPLSVFVCPSDSISDIGTNYRACNGTSPGSHSTIDLQPPDAALPGFLSARGRRLGQFVDGLSTTALFSEKFQGDRDGNTYTPRRDTVLGVPSGPSGFRTPGEAAEGCQLMASGVVSHASFGGSAWLFGGYGHTWYNHVLTPNSRTPDCTDAAAMDPNAHGAHTARSAHEGGVNVLFGDGSVRFVSESIDLAVWRGAATIAGREAIELP